MRLIMVLALLIFVIGRQDVSADTNSNQAGLLIQEVNGHNAGRYRVLEFPNGSTTNEGNGVIFVNIGTPATGFLTFLSSELTFNGSGLQFMGD